jgi:hypothetical protein
VPNGSCDRAGAALGGTGGTGSLVGMEHGHVVVRNVAVAAALVDTVGGRFSVEVGVDLDGGGDTAADRWFVCATLFGTRISTAVALRSATCLFDAGVTSVQRAAARPWDDLVALLDSAGYTRYDFRTATRLQRLGDEVQRRCGATVAVLARRHPDPDGLTAALGAFTGWGPVTVHAFLRELRGVWPGADPPLDARALQAAQHLGLVATSDRRRALHDLAAVADAAGTDLRDLEAACVRASMAHGRTMARCPGGARCVLVAQAMAASAVS